MEYNILYPSRELADYVKYYWSLTTCSIPQTANVQRIVPNGLMEIMLYSGGRMKSQSKNKLFESNLLISGQNSEFYDLEASGGLSIFAVVLKPEGAMNFLDLPLSEISNTSVPLKYISKDKIDELEDRLLNAVTPENRKQIVESYLRYILSRNRNEYEFTRIKRCISLINDTKGEVDIDLIVREACLCRKQFERKFFQYIGISPKQFLKSVRFQKAVYLKSIRRDLKLTSLAYDCGYFDQSHMINDFKSISGLTPGKYFSECEPYSDYFS